MEKNKNIYRYIAGACFSGISVAFILEVFFRFMYISGPTYLIGCILIAISMFTSMPILTCIGAGINLIYEIPYEIFLFEDGYTALWIISLLLFIVYWIPLIIAGVNKKYAKILGIAAGAVRILAYVLGRIDVYLWYDEFRISIPRLVIELLLIVGAILAGQAIASFKKREKVKVAAVPAQPSTEVIIDRLEKLKKLQDDGIITKEEFEEKKKQVLG